MGHIRLGVLPRYPRWKNIIALLEDEGSSASEVGARALEASTYVLEDPVSEAAIAHCIWMLSYLALSARSPDFSSRLARVGIEVDDETTASEFLARTFRVVSSDPSMKAASLAMSDIADAAFRESLTQTVGLEARTIFGSRLADVQRALRKYSTPDRFSHLLHSYFATFVGRTLRFVVEKEIVNHIGLEKRFATGEDLKDFHMALEGFAGQTTRIVDQFSAGWYSKKSWQVGRITKSEAERFTHVALKKLIADISLSSGGQ